MRGNKYGAKKTVVDNITFDSRAEAVRYCGLKVLFRAGKIHNLEIQPQFHFRLDGAKIFTYKADFAYFDGDQRIIEDVKGVRTAVYRLKKKLIEAQFNVKICEIRG
jgi:hypothetical protein